jgi:hypothetical protein
MTSPTAPPYGHTMTEQFYPPNWNDAKRQEFDALCAHYEIHENYASEARCIMGGKCKLIVVDNSGSQAWHLNNTETRLCSGQPTRRYDEAIEFVKLALPILAMDSDKGVDFYFLNPVMIQGHDTGQYFPGIHVWEDIARCFSATPCGPTPWCQTLEWVYKTYKNAIAEQGLVMIGITDGEPGGNERETKKNFYNMVKNRPNPSMNVHNFLITTDRDDEVAYLNRLDRKAKYVDVTDDYATERKQVLRAKGKYYEFSKADYVLKACIGGASKKIDRADETGCFCY